MELTVSQNKFAILFLWKVPHLHRSNTRKYTIENTLENTPVLAGRWTACLNEPFGSVTTSLLRKQMRS